MYKSMRCKKCGYDMTGPELLASIIDPSSEYAYTHHSSAALLNICTKSDSQITCPFCHTLGDWIK